MSDHDCETGGRDESMSESAGSNSGHTFRAVMDSVSDAIITTDLDFVIRSWNKAAESVYGWSAAEAVGRLMTDLIPTEYGDPSDDVVRERFQQTGAWAGRVLQTRSDGTRVPIHASVTTVVDEAGRPLMVVAINRDMTKQMQTEDTLRAVLDSTPIPVAVVDLTDNEIHFWSRSAHGLFGHTAPTASEWYLLAYPDPEYRQRVLARWKAALDVARETGQPVNAGEHDITCADGSVRTCELHASFTKDNLIVTFTDVTERNAALERLLLKDLVFASTISANSIADSSGVITDANTAFLELWGYVRKSEVVGKPISDFVDSEEDALRIVGALEQDDEWRGHYVARRKDGTTFVASSLSSVLRDKSGEPVGYQSSVVDATATFEAHQALKEQTRLLESYLDCLPGLFYVFDEERFVTWNKEWTRITGYRDDELAGMSGPDFFRGEDKTRMIAAMHAVFADGSADVEAEFVTKDGRAIPYYFTGQRRELQGKQYLLGLGVDITKRREADEALRASEEKYRTLAENIGIGVAMISPDMEILTLNRQMLEWFPGVDVSARPVCHRAFNDPPDEEPCSYCPTIKTLRDGQTHESTTETPSPDGNRHFRVVATPVRDADGEVIAAIEMVEDVTARTLAEKERAELENQFRQSQKMESVGRLAGGVAHDFNNLLTVILNCARLIKEGLGADDPLLDDVEEIDAAGRRAADLTRQLLTFSRKQIIEPRVINLNDVVTRAEKMLRRVLGEDIELIAVHEEDLRNVEADPGQMDQILVNLSVNARDAMQDGGKLTIETANVFLDEEYTASHPYTTPGAYVMLAVSDTGTGMDAETRSKVFEPFFTTKNVDQGTGLGLSTVYGVVKQSNGSIEVYSELGHGTTFKVYLPVVEADVEEGSPGEATALPRGLETILLVEDEPAVRKVAVRILEMGGYKVLEAAGPGEALALARQHGESIDLVLTDVVMPEMSGPECCEQLSKIVPDVKVLFMSGYTADAIARRGVLEKGTNFIPKPFTVDSLARKVREVLGSAETRESAETRQDEEGSRSLSMSRRPGGALRRYPA